MARATYKKGETVTYTFERAQLLVTIIGEVEGWWDVRFSDGSSCIVRPSRLSRSPKERDGG